MALSLLALVKSRIFGAKEFTADQIRLLIQQGRHEEARKVLPKLAVNIPNREALLLCLEGEWHYHQKQDHEAGERFRKALTSCPGLAEAHYGMSLLLAESDNGEDLNQATQHAQFATNINQNSPRFLAQLGFCHLKMGNIGSAEKALRKSTAQDPDNAYTWTNLGLALVTQGNQESARDCFRRALELKPDYQQPKVYLADLDASISDIGATQDTPQEHVPVNSQAFASIHALVQNNKLQEAITACEAWSADEADNEEAAITLLDLYNKAGDPQSGIEGMVIWLSRHPQAHLAAKSLGMAYLKVDAKHKAAKLLEQATQQGEPDKVGLRALAVAYSGLDRHDEANAALQRALDADPEDTATQSMLATNLSNLCRYEDALVLCESLAANGVHSPCYGSVLSYLGRFDEALQYIERELAQQPNNPNLRMQRANIRLLHEDFEHGWPDYAYRTLVGSANLRILPFPVWRGEALTGKKVAVVAEQGLGDQIMFASCLPDLLDQGPRQVIVEVIKRISPTLERSFPKCTFIPTDQNHVVDWISDHPDVDFYIHAGDLPARFRLQAADFPRSDRYLVADDQKVDKWRNIITAWERTEGAPGAHRPRIGISWRGGTPGTRAAARTLDAVEFTRLSSRFDATWVCLQYGDVEDALRHVQSQGLSMAYWPESISDLDEFAAMIESLDLIISVCNTTIHYAGALGKETWVLAPSIPEWRYGLTFRHMPWYPSTTVMRQETPGDWAGLLEQVAATLQERWPG